VLALACASDRDDDGRAPGGGYPGGDDGGGDGGDDGGTGDGGGGTGDGGDGGTGDGGDDGGTGDGGDDGGTDDGGDSTIPVCLERCEDDADCYVGGEPSAFACEDNRCLGETSSNCTSDEDCIPIFSGWYYTCNTTDDCSGQVCIDIGEAEGRCATAPTEYVACADIDMVEIEMPLNDGTGNVIVCARLDTECNEDGYCFDPCEVDADCEYYPGMPVCETSTGRCICTSDGHCAGATGVSVCVDGYCLCANDQDCLELPAADTCYDGYCGCSDVSICTTEPTFDGTTWACEPW
jgi:hypothetical protein